MGSTDAVFAGSIPALYDRHLGPLLFEPYAVEMAARLADFKAGMVLESAAGTGIVTQVIAERLPPAVGIVATDLNQAMLDFAATKPGMARAKLRQADALALPFDGNSFDAVVCQFGVMFFPDRVLGYREAHRVLRPGGRTVIAIWDSLEHNPIPRCVNDAIAAHFPADPPRFMARTPHGHFDQKIIRTELAAAGFDRVTIDVVTLPSRAPSHRDPAIGFCQGSPLRGEIEARAPHGLAAATEATAEALARAFGAGPIEAPMQALLIVAQK
jgi:ubiquinone/menaquinone biosynthesis C-methylase UbiE